MTIKFVGAGPGDPELITLKGHRALMSADIVIYAGSLVNPALLEYCKETCTIYDSATMTLEEIIAVCHEGVLASKQVVRLHTGDFSIFGSLREQIEALTALGHAYTLIPGVSSFLGAASSLNIEYTVPEISQSLIITRKEGRTPVPALESLERFASHQTSMAIFLSSGMVEGVVEDLIRGGYTEETPVAIVYKATWPDEKIIRGTLSTIAALANDADIHKTALIIVGKCLGETFHASKLYDKDFTHAFR